MAEYLIQDTTAQGIVDKIKTKAGVSSTLAGSEIEDAIDSILTPTDGTIPTKTSSNLTASGATVTVPAGYYASQASKSVSTATKAKPTISVSSSGVVSASYTQSAGYVTSGTVSANSVTLSSSHDSDFKASNIKSGVTIFGVTGTYVPVFA